MSRTLVFYYKLGGLTKDVNIFFTFSPLTELALSDTQNRVAWKIYKLKAKPDCNTTGQFTVFYPATLGFNIAEEPETSSVNLPGLAVKMKPGQSTDLTVAGWSEPTDIGGAQMEATNQTDMFQNIYVSTVVEKEGINIPSPTFMFKVGAGNSAHAEFHPQLMMYHDVDCQPNGLMTDSKTKPIWQVNLAALPKYSSWKFSEGDQGAYKVTALSTDSTHRGSPDEDEDIVVIDPVPYYQLK
ncbi:hypothetical protein L218DRAFT_990948 [Marasmius fiardii PR-910]|nr:hypothetical protein L218DRAFT_990948 [Marasmius fiardii PR-910]